MSRPIYRKDPVYVQDMTACTIHSTNGDAVGLSPRRKAILRTLNCFVTPRQRQCLYLYYGRGMAQEAIAHALGIDVSTVSRNIAHGDQHVRAMLEEYEEDL